jgi:hypothetical protein
MINVAEAEKIYFQAAVGDFWGCRRARAAGAAAELFVKGLCLPSGTGMSEDEQTRVV